VDWSVSEDSTIARVHQHATTITRPTGAGSNSTDLRTVPRHLLVARAGRGDKSFSSRAIRGHLRDRGIVAVIPEPADQVGHREHRGSRGGRPPALDSVDYCGRNVVERQFHLLKQWRGLASRYDKLTIV